MKQKAKALPAVLETAKQGREASLIAGVETEIWTENMLAALENGVKGGKWFSLIDKVYSETTLRIAWKQVQSNQGSAGIDKQSIERFEANANHYLKELHEALKEGSYSPQGVKRIYLPKAGTGKRPLGIPVVKDRIVQTAIKRVIEPLFEKEFLDSSYGFRPARGCKDALRKVDSLLKTGHTWVVDADLKSYFDTIDHDKLMEYVASRISDARLLRLIESYLKQEIIDGLKRWTPEAGTPQGAVLSPLLANIYLHPLDQMLNQEGYQMVRYADDFVILCRTRQEAEKALSEVRGWVKENALELHPDKTHLGDSSQKGEGFEFLGYRFEAGRRYVRKKSLKSLRDKVRAKTRRNRSGSLREIIDDLNPLLRGWYGYFKHAHRTTFKSNDGFVRRRLRALILKRNRKKGWGMNVNVHRRYPNAYFAKLELFTSHEAWVLASQSR
jgi:RNA-directed DNA polymerase